MSDAQNRQHRRLYGRAKGHALSARQQQLVDTMLPGVSWPDEGGVDPRSLLPGFDTHVLEIGFGAAEHLTGQAVRAPRTGFVGIEPFLNGVAKALAGIEEHGLSNVRVKRADARDEIERMPDASFDRIFLLFPDPWPKKRHAFRRFVQEDTAAQLARILKPGGRLRVATDVRIYADWALPLLLEAPGLDWQAEKADDWRIAPADHITTRYQSKHLGDIDPVFMDFERRAA
ncbi:tRNA (guanine-N(7)-)-methyltransferase [Glycocaulis albus]|uniref:tRNA (guanine-N(7)-)-methyltransferase n=1 Tax=Glycocaulis albus TaxID=1382801 RepID=A0ABQ1XJY4_9PROT|nr:tRNA (guanosine(46)-N7)-methyltransferase TrmB [Glycocaulis albus]MBV5259242.1 tRNA (guanosine(46)-N7)-methyltransferase TrmB [Synechococcus moorigangaii CMS01]GGG95665.1 tRNA (guanine-N(7)-)-methyltransferase [Glycocaulis albus]